ncbi:MAG TPA: MYXO-CTERM sorting domain-containing protein, partial [Polyangiaceae bacterium LLY-WYZ-15_(1-7)]|nr:MYXO-CTERM sorting domain-containing protein [Polyangiaceae bacterium LLY-WYZ-15_(1-7)]
GSRLRAPAPALAANAGLATLLAEDVPSLEVEAAAPAGGGEPGSGGGTDDTPPAAAQGEGGGCAGCAVGGPEGAAGAALFVLALGWTLMRRRD